MAYNKIQVLLENFYLAILTLLFLFKFWVKDPFQMLLNITPQ